MTIITLALGKFSYNKETKTFTMSERDVRFDTSYELNNPDTYKSMKFDFVNSTGSEWDPNTKWIYKSGDYTLEICNDPAMTQKAAADYLAAKTRKNLDTRTRKN